MYAGKESSTAPIGHLEDDAHSSGDAGIMALVVRKDTAASTAGTDGDYCALVSDSTGRLHVNVGNTVTVGSHAVTNAGTFVVQIDGAALTSLQLIDDAVSGSGFNISQMGGANVSMGVGISGTGVQRVVLATDVALPAGTNAIGKLAANSGVDIGDVDVTSVPTDPFGANADAASATGSISAKLRFIAGTGIPITGTVTVGSHAVTNAGTFAVQVDGSALTALQLIDNLVLAEDAVHGSGDAGVQALAVRKDTAAALAGTDGDYAPLEVDANGRLHTIEPSAATIATNTGNAATSLGVMDDWDNAASNGASVSGDVAHDAADAGEPVKIGGKASVGTTPPSGVADLDRVDAMFDACGRVVVTDCPRTQTSDATVTIAASTSETTILPAIASTFLDMVCVVVANTSATAARVDFRGTTGGAVRFSVYAPAGQTVGFVPKVPLQQASVNTNWTAQSSASITDLRIFMQAIKKLA